MRAKGRVKAVHDPEGDGEAIILEGDVVTFDVDSQTIEATGSPCITRGKNEISVERDGKVVVSLVGGEVQLKIKGRSKTRILLGSESGK